MYHSVQKYIDRFQSIPLAKRWTAAGVLAALIVVSILVLWRFDTRQELLSPNLEQVSLYNSAVASVPERPAEIASQPVARWFVDADKDAARVAAERLMNAAEAADAVPVMVAYNIPERDCGSYSAGGAASPEAYRAWIRALADGIGRRQAIVVLEPDALAAIGCLSPEQQRTRTELLTDAVTVLNDQTESYIYIDAGNAGWESVGTMAGRLEAANIEDADGFALNVANFFSTERSVAYGNQLAERVGKRFIVDTSRNGNGAASNNEWCNPPGRALGRAPTTSTGEKYVDAYLWIKLPGESDGTCNGGPPAGQWWPEYAQGLIQAAEN